MNKYNLLALLAVVIHATAAADICTPSTIKKGDPIKPVIDYSYSAEVVAKNVIAKTVILYTQDYDWSTKNMAFVYTYLGFTTGKIWNVNNNAGYAFNESACIPYANTNARYIQERSLEVLFGMKGPWVYQDQKEIRGVTVNYWTSCFKNSTMNFKSDFYFTTDNIPFRLVLQGTRETSKYHSIHDFFRFVKGTPDKSSFEIPAGITCPFHIEALNPMPQSGSYKAEEIIPSLKLARSSEVYYDRALKVYKSTKDNATEIRDHKRGLKFMIKDGTCTRGVLSRVSKPDQVVSKNGNVHMATLEHFLMLDGNFTSNGEGIAREIKVDVYTKNGRSAEQFGSTNSLILSMGSKKVKIYNNVGFNELVQTPPVRITIMGGKPRVVNRQIEIYDFDADQVPLVYPFDMSQCYSKEKTKSFTLTMTGPDAKTVSFRRRLRLTYAIMFNVSQALGIPALRVQPTSESEPYVNEKNQYLVNGLLFDKEGYHQTYEEKINTFVKLTPAVDHTSYDNPSNTPTLCGEYCANVTKRPFEGTKICYNFMFNRASKTCTLLYGGYYSSLSNSPIVDYYSRSYSSYNDYVSLDKAWYTLQKAVKNGNLNYTETAENGTVLGIYKVVKVVARSPENVPSAADPLMKHFVSLTEGNMFRRDPIEIIKTISQRACVLRCLNNLNYFCKGFRYTDRVADTECKLYDNTENTEMSSSEKAAAKKQYELFSIDISMLRNVFEEFKLIPGMTLLSATSDYVYTHLDALGCAELCIRGTQIYCQSFEICGDVCLLGTSHVFNLPKSSLKGKRDCIHFSRIYIGDYVKIPKKKALADPSVIEMKGISVERCAHLCSTSPDYDCNVFEYCDSISTCLVVPKSVSDTSSLAYKKTGNCEMYKRRKGLHRVINNIGQVSSSMFTTGQHSAGAMGGLGVGMIILGCLLMVAIGIIVFKLRSPRAESGGTISFSKKRLDEEE